MKKPFFDANNFPSEIYSTDSIKAFQLWKQPATVSFPVAIRYSCEYFATDVRADFDKIKCPVLVLRAMFNTKVTESAMYKSLSPQFIDTWNDAATRNPLIKVKDMPDAATFVWKDKPADVNKAVKEFVDGIK
jgi:pimeloyl-ACP methyl ester carboxylesterase